MNGYLGKRGRKGKKNKGVKKKAAIVPGSATASYINADNTGELTAKKDSARPSNLNGFLNRFYQK